MSLGSQSKADNVESNNQQGSGVAAPAITLPKGGGAIRGLGEKFSANPVTGTGSMSVPIATSPSRSGFGPQLSLSYDSGASNGPFGLGWNLSLPAISRKTDKGLPKYEDAQDSDIFILSGTEDLVPLGVQNDRQAWQKEAPIPRIVNGITYHIQRYRPRIEGLFARIEHWINPLDIHDNFWRSISKDNITTWYGKTAASRISDPANPARIFSWLLSESYDDKGNVIVYAYVQENAQNIDLTQAHERNREQEAFDPRSAQRYLKRILYGNHQPYLPRLTANSAWPAAPGREHFFFEVVFDYGDHDMGKPLTHEAAKLWSVRNDPFSSYRAGFEVRTYRLCQRVLMFHHFPDEPDVGQNCLVRSTDFTYSYEIEPDSTQKLIFSCLHSATQTGYQRNEGGGYLAKSLPPLEFEYTQAIINEKVQEIDRESLENLPYGFDGANYQWVDLDGEGLSGILTEQADGWFYKRNLSANHQLIDSESKTERTIPCFSPVELIAKKPNLGLRTSRAQLMDLAGNGQIDLVEMDASVRGFYERTPDEDWEQFRPFEQWPTVDTRNPNLKFIDLTGDGNADILISEDEAFVWYASLAEAGFAAAIRVQQVFEEEQGPRLVFADTEQSIYLADFSGDGLTDIVRIRNGEVCYWPNLGYCRFGAKITMDNSPYFDYPDLFDQRRIRLADIDGSGVIDLLYLSGKGVQLYFNQSGNSWSGETLLEHFPAIDNLSSVQVVDLLGNGTACLVWSSPLPGNGHCPMYYIDLMGGQKPYLLTKTVNNLGAETRIEYVPSTRFYLNDKLAGTPWVTKLPFPVHCVEKVTVFDKWRNTQFSSSYSYHHGYFDGAEREFRGFGRVEQVDVESYGQFQQGNAASPYITADQTLYQPPVKTITWYHTGAYINQKHLLSQFAGEYFKPDGFQEHALPEPHLRNENLSPEEWRQALRACKGMVLRQEVYELDVDQLEQGKHQPVKLYSSTYHNCIIQCLQKQGPNKHAVFLVAESEAITYHYELDLNSDRAIPDPRIAHTLNLKIDEYAQVLQSVAVVYPRIGKFEEDAQLSNGLMTEAIALINTVQKQEVHIAYSETHYTKDFGSLDDYRLRLPCEVLSYELTGIKPQAAYFTLAELRRFQLSQVHQQTGLSVQAIPHHQIADQNRAEKRLVEHARTLFFQENLVDPLPFGEHGRLGLTYENYQLALTDDLLNAIFTDAQGFNKLNQNVDGANTVRGLLHDSRVSGYLSGDKLTERFVSVLIPANELAGQYWIRSGIAGFANDAAQHFYLPERYTDPFGNTTVLSFDKHDLFIQSSTDAIGNTAQVTRFDFRVLAPCEMQDINDNLSEVFFDVLGLPTAMAVKGKGAEGDHLNGFNNAVAHPERSRLLAFFMDNAYDEPQAREWLGNATARHVYYFGETIQEGKVVWGTHPACACSIVREKHVAQLAANESSPVQTAFEYSDGMGSVVVKKVQAEPEKPGQPLRWVANGKTILNNKGKPVKQYEPYFCLPETGHRFEEPKEVGVTAVIYYDAASRVVRTDQPDGSYSRVEFSPWHVRSFDPNDTVLEAGNRWFANQTTPAGQRAARLAAEHADTPALTILDSLGREVIAIAHNRAKDAAGVLKDEKYLTYSKLDAEGKPLWIRDARNNRVMQYINPPVPDNQLADPLTGFVPCYDIAGNLLFQHSMEAGDRWILNDAAGKPMFAWNSRGFFTQVKYDALHRPIASFVTATGNTTLTGIPRDPLLPPTAPVQFEKLVYGEGQPQDKQHNLRGKLYRHSDTAGVATVENYDFKGNPLSSSRQLTVEYKTKPDWSGNPLLEANVHTTHMAYDALNRPITLTTPDNSVYRPRFNEANLLEKVEVNLHGLLKNGQPVWTPFVNNIDYNAKGQRVLIAYGNGATTTYAYDEKTFRLINLKTTRPNHADITATILFKNATVVQDLHYSYDPVGNITRIADAAQQTIFHGGQQIEAVSDYAYDALYRLMAASGRERKGATQNDWNDNGNSIAMPPNGGEALGCYVETYSYDAVGNILRMIHHAGSNIEQPGAVSWHRRYHYAEPNNRLLATSLPGDNQDTFSAKYSYDQHGNMVTMPHLPLMRWDFKDQLQATSQQVRNDGGTPEITYFVYDGSGQRVRKVTERQSDAGQTPTRSKERIYLGGFEIYREYNGDGATVTLERQTLHIMDDKQAIALVETRTNGKDDSPRQLIRYQLGNHLGSATLELSAQGAIVSYEEYTPYGSTAYQGGRSAAEVGLKRYRYTGKERDGETGLYYHGARYYAAWLGRWVSCDPIGISDGVDIYAYGKNNPLTNTDLNGTACDIRTTNCPESISSIDDINFTSGELRRVPFAPHVDEVDAVKGDRAGGVAGSPSDPENKQLLDQKTNSIVKKNFITNAPRNPRPNVSFAASPEEAANRFITGRFSEVDEVRVHAEEAAAATRPGLRTNSSLRPRLSKDPAIRNGLQSIGVNPDTFAPENPEGLPQFPTSGVVNFSSVDADIDPNTGEVVSGPNTSAANARRAAKELENSKKLQEKEEKYLTAIEPSNYEASTAANLTVLVLAVWFLGSAVEGIGLLAEGGAVVEEATVSQGVRVAVQVAEENALAEGVTEGQLVRVKISEELEEEIVEEGTKEVLKRMRIPR